jgi:branched-chain amino acid transport system ATP-binding protein
MPDLTTDRSPLLETTDLALGYGSHAVVSDVNIVVGRGEIVGLLGANGAGKTTTLLGLVGELKPMSGAVCLYGAEATDSLHHRSRRGLGFLAEERSVIASLSVVDNLRLGRGDVESAFDTFPELKPLRNRSAKSLSGGEQQILAFARALSRSPKVLIADELSLGLAPLVVERLTIALAAAASQGVGVLVVEQQVHTALAISDRAYVLQRGKIVLEGKSDRLLANLDEIEHRYLAE